MKRRALVKTSSALVGYGSVLRELVALIESARRAAARSVNAVMTATYFLVGRAIVEEEQKGGSRAAYGEQLLERLVEDLSRPVRARLLESERRLDAPFLPHVPRRHCPDAVWTIAEHEEYPDGVWRI